MDDKLKQLYELYSRNGLIKTTDYNTFSSANENQRKQLYDLGKRNGLFKSTDYNTFSTAFSPVKKKGSTGLPSQTQKKGTTSATVKTTTRKPSVSSGGQKVEIFTGLPGKEENQYRVINNQWQRLLPNTNKWEDISNEGSISYLNKYYGKKVSAPKQKDAEIDKPLIGSMMTSFLVEKRLEDDPNYYKSEDYVKDLKSLNYNDVERIVENKKSVLSKNLSDASFVENKEGLKRAKESLNKFYNSEEYKIYQEKKNQDTKIKSDKIEDLYLELNNAKSDKEKKEVQKSIDKYLSDELIKNQSKQYDNKISEVNASYKKLKGAINQLNLDKIDAEQRFKSGAINEDEYLNISDEISRRAEYLDSRRNQIKTDFTSVNSDMNQLQKIAGKYVASKEKSGGFVGNMWNSFLNGVSKTVFELPIAFGNEAFKRESYEALSPEEKQTLKNKGFTEEQAINYVANKNLLASKEEIRKGLISGIGATGTTKEYMQSKDRGFFESALAGVAESIPGMLMPGGAAARFTALSAQAYSSIEDEMLNDKDFETSSASERATIAVPYAMGMGFLENLGVTTLLSKNPIAKSLITRSIVGAVGKLGGDITKEGFEKVLNKEIKSNMAKFGVKVVGGALAEAETGGLQSLTLDIGLKGLYNTISDAYDGKLSEKLTGGEYFDTPDSFKEGTLKVLEDAAAEAVGGFVLSSIGTSAERVINGDISLYDDKDVEFLKSISSDSELKKMFVAKLKTNMLNGKMTKSEAQTQLDAVNKLYSTFGRIPDNMSGNDLKSSLSLIIEKDKLEQEIAGKDENLVAAQKSRITEINNQLKTISENAVQKQAQDAQKQPAIPAEISNLKDDEVVSFKVASLEDVPEEFRDKAKKIGGGEIETRKSIFGLPFGKKETVTVPEAYSYSLTGKEVKDYAVQKQAAGEVPVQPEAAVSGEMAQGEPQAEPQVTTEEGQAVGQEEVAKRISELEALIASDNVSMEKEGQGNLIPEARQSILNELQDLKQQETKVETTSTIETKKADIETRRKDIISRKSTQEEKFQFLENIPEGTVIKNEDGDALIIRKNITKRGTESYELVPLFINEDGSWEENYNGLKIVEKKANGEFNINAELPQIFTSNVEIILPTESKYNAELAALEGNTAKEEVVEPTKEEIDLESKLAEDLGMIKSETKPRLRVGGIDIPAEEDIDLESIETNLDRLPVYEVNFVTPTLSKDIKVNPIEESKSQVKEGTAEIRTIESFEGIPMVVGMSDTLAAGTVVDSVGNPMDVEGGLLYNVLGKNKNAAWAGVTEGGAETQYNEALDVYNSNKNLFDKLWSEGKLPNGHIPMAIMRMADTAINSNEAVFRYLAPLVKSQPKQNQRAALEALKESINTKKKVKLEVTVKSANKLDNFISSNNINSLGQLLDMIVNDANKRAKGDTENTLSLTDRTLLFDLMISDQGTETSSKNPVIALFGSKNDPKSKAFLADTIYNDISEPSMMKTPKGYIVAVVGIDVLNGGVIPVNHGNYGFGPKGKMIALISNPKHGLDVFPEWKAKATRVFKENKKGEIPSDQKIGDEVGGAFFIDKAFRGAKVSMETSDVELLSAKLRFAFPDVAVSNSKEEFDRVLQEEGVRTKESDGKVILGMTKDGKIYLNPESDSLATPIHEFGHIWIDFLRSKASGKKGDALLSKGLSLVEGTKALKQAIAKYGDNALAREEALVELMATKGETIINESQKKQFKNWLNALFKYVKNFFVNTEELFKDKKFNEYIDKMSLDDFINIGLADLFKGKEVNPKFKARDTGKGAAELRFRVGNSVQNFVDKARDNGYSDSAIRNVLIRNGVTKEDVETALGKYGKELKEVVAKAKEKYDLSIERGNSEQKAQQSAMADLKKNDWYANANDKQREEAVRALTKELGGKIKKAPSAKKILGEPKAQTVTNNIATLRNEFIKARATAARESQQDLKRRQREIIVAVNNMKRSGTVTAAQAASLAKKITYLNVYNPVMVDRFLQYAERLFKNAEYQNILSEASKVRKSIKNFMKTNQANVVAMAKDFGKINPAMVEDIEQYLENAKAVLNAVRRSKQDTDFPIKNAADIDVITKYTEDMLEKQEEQLKNEKLKEYQDLVDQGILSGDMTLKDINEVIKAIEEEGPNNRAKQETELRRFLNTRFEMYSTIVKSILKTNVDPFTGDTVEISDKDKEVLKRLLKVNLDDMSIPNAYTIVESMDNFIVNGITDGLDGAISAYEGDIEAKNLLKEGVKADKIKGLLFGLSPVTGRAIYENFATLPVLFDSLFKGVKSGMKVMNAMGFNSLSRGFAKATKIYNNAINNYGEIFSKSKPNGQQFNTSFNAYERGMLAYLKRTIPGNETAQKAEFKRRVELIRESIQSLREYGNEDQQKMANIYEEVYTKLGLDNADITIDQVQANVDPKNVEAVNWWIDQWSQHYSDLYDVSLDVYNTKLGKDINYTTDRISRVDGERELVDEATGNIGAFALDLGLTSYKDKAGVLMESNKNFKSLDTGKKSSTRFVNLDFDVSNASALRSALIDINTASAIRRVDAFLNSRSYDKLFAEEKDAKILKRRVQNYILRYKNKIAFSDPTLGELDKYMDMVASIGATRALGGPSQAVLQTVPVFASTLINAGPTNVDFKGLVSDTDFHTWLNNSGYSIANRGMETSTAIESANKYLDKIADTKGEKFFKGVMKLNEFWLKAFLSMPDVWIARNAWKAYYTQSLKEQGLYNGSIDWTTHELNEEAADYAQHMVDRQQNVSDAAMMGDFMNSQQPIKKIVRKVVLPFANFIMNQKTRLYSDVRTLSSSTSTKEDKIKSAKSLAGLAVEMSAYNAIGYALKLYVYDAIAASLTGGDDDEEEKQKNKENRKKFVAQNLIKDVFSPVPIADGLTIQGFNIIADKFQDMTISQEEINKAIEERNIYLESRNKDPMTGKEKDKFVKDFIKSQKMVFEEYETKKWIDLGTATIAIEKARELYNMIEMSSTGKFKQDFNGNEVEKVILPDNKGDMIAATTMSALYNLGLLPREFNSVATSMKKKIEKNAISESQLEDYKVIKKEFGDVDGYKKDLLKSKMKIDNVIEEIEWVEENGGLTIEQSAEYKKLREIQGEVYIEDLKKLQKGIKADKIYKRGN